MATSTTGTTETKRIPWEALRERCQRILERAGMRPEDAFLVADSLVMAELRGVRSHGVVRLPVYVERIRRGVLDPRAELRVVRDHKAVATLDACDGHGIPAGVRAMDRCIEKAREYGVGAVAVRRSNHFGAAWYFARRAVEAGMIGVAAANADAFVAPWGAARRYLGTNPIAIGIPAGEEPPIALDMATSAVAHGRIMLAKQRGESIPLGWALDREGRPTTDPSAALEGALLPFGEAKGSALSLIIDLLCGPLAGALTGPFIAALYADLDRPQRLGHFFMAIDVAAFADPAEFRQRVDESIRAIRALPPAHGFERVYLPGEPEWLNEQRNRQQGLVLEPATERQLVELEASLGLAG
ncbi:MAG TPA: Ldh family oxidoreductase [Limnochordales bacterium]